jgi:hypothetical protein
VRRLVAHWFLAAALVVAQLGIQAHALSHLEEALYEPFGFLHHPDHEPELCLAFDAATGGAVAPSALSLGCAAPVATGPALGHADPLLPPRALERFASRAPPVRS